MDLRTEAFFFLLVLKIAGVYDLIYHQKKKKKRGHKTTLFKRILHKLELHNIAGSYINPFDPVFTGGNKNK